MRTSSAVLTAVGQDGADTLELAKVSPTDMLAETGRACYTKLYTIFAVEFEAGWRLVEGDSIFCAIWIVHFPQSTGCPKRPPVAPGISPNAMSDSCPLVPFVVLARRDFHSRLMPRWSGSGWLQRTRLDHFSLRGIPFARADGIARRDPRAVIERTGMHMAGFQTHITVSSAVGVGCAWFGATQLGLPQSTCAVAGGLCAIAGMMPDLDSDTGVPARETVGFAAAIMPLLLYRRLWQNGMGVDQLFLVGAPLYLFVRFGLGTLLKRFTVHRGMFHSIPAMAIAGLLTYLVCDSGYSTARVYKAVAASIGFLSHLVLDEIWSVEVGITGTRVKSSFGTAVKLFGKDAAANSMCYGLLLLVGLAVIKDLPPPGHQPALVEQNTVPGSPIFPPVTLPSVAIPPVAEPGSPDVAGGPPRNPADPNWNRDPYVPLPREPRVASPDRPRWFDANGSDPLSRPISPAERPIRSSSQRNFRPRQRPVQPIVDELGGAAPDQFLR